MFFDGPLAKKEPSKFVLQGKPFSDDYKYMENLHDATTVKFARLEQDHHYHVDGRLDLQSGKFRLWSESECRSLITSREGGFDKGEERIGDFIYYTRKLEGESIDVGFFRKRPGQADILGEELINPHELKRQFGYSHCSIGVCRVSDDGRYVAYTLSVEGGDRYICHVRSIDNASLFHVIRSTNVISIEFGSSNNSFYYTECNELNRPYRVMMQEVRPGLLSPPVEIYRDDDETYFVDVRKTKDSKFLVFSSDAKGTGNVLVLPASFPTIPKDLQVFFPHPAKPKEIAGKDAWGWLEHHSNCFLMVTSRNAPNYEVVYVRDEIALHEGVACQRWAPLIPHRDDVQITDVDLFENQLVAFEQHLQFERLQHIRIVDLRRGIERANKDRTTDVVLHFPALVNVTPGLNKNFKQDVLSFVYSSIIQPPRECVYNLNAAHDAKAVRTMAPTSLYTQRQHETLSPWDYMWPYHMYRDFVTSHDGTQVPITICQKRDLFTEEITDYDPLSNTPRHCLLYVYGSYGEIPSTHFQLLPYLWLMRRRWVVAFAHVRGGGELGHSWAEAGKGRKKMNTVRDFVACCEHLVKQGFTTPQNLVVAGNSAGAVPIAAAANMHGNTLFNFALLRAPFLDITSTMMDPNLPLSIAEQQDWGDPLNSRADLDAIAEYDPYLNVNDKVTYPSMMISTCLDDDRVPAWNALKYVAKLREVRRKQGVDPIRDQLVLRCKNVGGHHYWNDMLPLAEEINMLIHHYGLPGFHCKTEDLDMMQQMHNYFSTGLMDHDDQQQTWLKWDAWEKERLDFFSKMNTMTHEPNYRALKAKKEVYYWHNSVMPEHIANPKPQMPQKGGSATTVAK